MYAAVTWKETTNKNKNKPKKCPHWLACKLCVSMYRVPAFNPYYALVPQVDSINTQSHALSCVCDDMWLRVSLRTLGVCPAAQTQNHNNLLCHKVNPRSLAYSQSYDFGGRFTKGIGFPSQMRGADAKESSTQTSNCMHTHKSMLAGLHVDTQDGLFCSGVDVLVALMHRHPGRHAAAALILTAPVPAGFDLLVRLM